MNERIKQLIEEATFVEPDYFRYFDKQKFATLLINECCDMMMELRTRPADLTVKDIKLHFGVE